MIQTPERQRGIILPSDFIPVAEATGAIHPLGEWVLRTACAEAATWPLPIKVAVNVSVVQFTLKEKDMGMFRSIARGSIVAVAAVFMQPVAGISTACEAAASSPSPADPAYWTTPPDPLDLDVTLDAAHAATALIDSKGGAKSTRWR